MKLSLKSALGLAAIAAVLSSPLHRVSAHDGATGVVKERMDAMKAMGGAMKQLAAMMKGQTAFDAMSASQAGMTINEKANGLIKLFPEGSGEASSYAKPEVWSKWSEFEAATRTLIDASAKLADAEMDAGKNDIMPLFAGVGKTCKGCHETFRRPKEK